MNMRATFTIKQIFQNHWDTFLDTQHQVRPVVVTEIEKMIQCGAPANGNHLFYCHDCKRSSMLLSAVNHAFVLPAGLLIRLTGGFHLFQVYQL